VNLPDLGVGVIYLPGLESLIKAGDELLDVVEIEPQTSWFIGDSGYRESVDFIRLVESMPQRKLVHGVGFPIGGTCPPDPKALLPFARTVRRLASPWCSEHLSFNRVINEGSESATLFLLPPIQSAESVEVAVSNIRSIQGILPSPFAFETGVNYLQPHPRELSDGSFFAAIAEEADCGILVDLHNLWCNEKNGRQSVWGVLDELPLERVWEVHLAGGQEVDGYWMDAHSGPVPDALLELASDIIPTLPNVHAIVFEIIPEYLTSGQARIADILTTLERIRGMWEDRTIRMPARIQCTALDASSMVKMPDNNPPNPRDWELALARAVLYGDDADPLGAWICSDPGTQVISKVIGQARAGTVADAMRYTFRLVLLSRGEERLRDLLTTFWRGTPPQLFGARESAAFGNHLLEQAADIPYLQETVALELSLHRAQCEGVEQRVQIGCNPIELLTVLGEGRLPQIELTGTYEVIIPAP